MLPPQVCEYLVKKIPVPVRDFTSPPQVGRLGAGDEGQAVVSPQLQLLLRWPRQRGVPEQWTPNSMPAHTAPHLPACLLPDFTRPRR